MPESVQNLLDEIFILISSTWITLSDIVFQYKLPIVIFMILFVALFRIIMANLLYVRRHDKADWAVWGIFMFVQLVVSFIALPWLWTLSELVIIGAIIGYCVLQDKTKQVVSTIYSGNIVYEDNSDRYNNGGDSEAQAIRKQKDAAVHRSWEKSRTHMKMKVPVLVTRFRFKISPTYTEEQVSKVIAQLNKYYADYNWRRNLSNNGIFCDIVAEVKTDKNLVVKFDKELSDQLDWYVVPLGAIDVSNQKTAHETPYVWLMHDPKTEGKTYPALEKTRTFTPAPQGFVVGQTGGGKSVLLNNMIAHFVNKAKQDGQALLYLADAKRVEFRPYESLEEVAGVATSLQEAVDLSDDFVDEMMKRLDMMQREGIKSIPLDGHVDLKRFIDINGTLIYGADIIEFKTSDGKIHKDRAMNLKGRTDIIEINMPEEEKEEEEDDKDSMSSFW